MDRNPYTAPVSIADEASSVATGFRLVCIAISCVALAFCTLAAGFSSYEYFTADSVAPNLPPTLLPVVICIFAVAAFGFLWAVIRFWHRDFRSGLIAGSLAGLLLFPGARIIMALLYGPS